MCVASTGSIQAGGQGEGCCWAVAVPMRPKLRAQAAAPAQGQLQPRLATSSTRRKTTSRAMELGLLPCPLLRCRRGEENGSTASWAVYQCADRIDRPDRAQARQTKFLRLSATPSLREVGFASNALIPPPGGSSWLIIDGRGHHGLTEARQEHSSPRAIVRTTGRKRNDKRRRIPTPFDHE